jgi:hypothetical protein
MNLLCYRKPDVTCWSDASLTSIGGHDSNGKAWRWEIPMNCRGRLTLNGLEYLASIITIHLYLSSHESTFPCILSLLDSTSAIGWLHRSSFDFSSHSIHAKMARHLATIMIDHQACLYSQHIPGTNNVIVDSLSRDFHIDTDTLSSLIHSHFQVPDSFTIYPLTDEIVSWLTSLMLSKPRQLELKHAHTPSATWLGVGGSNRWRCISIEPGCVQTGGSSSPPLIPGLAARPEESTKHQETERTCVPDDLKPSLSFTLLHRRFAL